MINSSFRLVAAVSLLVVMAPMAHAASAFEEQVQAEQQDTTPPAPAVSPAATPIAPTAHVKTPAHAKDSADLLKDSALAAPYVPPAATEPKANAPETETPKAEPVPVTAPAVKPQKVALGSLTMRQPMPQLNQIALWREDGDKAAQADVWDGTIALDVQTILPALVMAKNQHVKDIILRIAMSGVYSPQGMTDMDYIRWRADVLMAQKHPELAARLLSTARLGRDDREDAETRTAYELAANETEAACVESMATGADKGAFWQGMAVLCARHLGDPAATKALVAALPDGAIKTAANAANPDDLKDAVVKASGAMPAAKTIPDNHEILVKLTQLLSDINDDDDSKAAATKNKGQLLLLSLGALRATKHGDDTQKLTDQALQLAGF